MRDVLSLTLMAAGLAVVVASCLALALVDDAMDRLHVVTPASTLGVTGVCASVVVRNGLDPSGSAAVLLAAVVVGSSPLISHACARSIEVRRRSGEGPPSK